MTPSHADHTPQRVIGRYALFDEIGAGGMATVHLGRLLGQPTDVARCELLARRGIGPETADAILLYAGGHPTFVIDAYAQRLLTRLGWIGGSETDDALRAAFQRAHPGDVARANEYHALIVRHGKEHCRRRPLCPDCPLASLCPAAEATSPGGVR